MLVLVGDLTGEREALIHALGIRESVRQPNNLNDEELVILYSLADLSVFPSISEGFGWPPLEAMACGCPVVASNAGSLPEVCGDACLHVNLTNTNEIAEAIGRVLGDEKLRDSLIVAGRIQAAKYSWKSTAAAFLGLFQG